MNEIVVNVNGQTFIIPAEKHGELISWLNLNKDQSVLKSEAVSDPRQLILENGNNW